MQRYTILMISMHEKMHSKIIHVTMALAEKTFQFAVPEAHQLEFFGNASAQALFEKNVRTLRNWVVLSTRSTSVFSWMQQSCSMKDHGLQNAIW